MTIKCFLQTYASMDLDVICPKIFCFLISSTVLLCKKKNNNKKYSQCIMKSVPSLNYLSVFCVYHPRSLIPRPTFFAICLAAEIPVYRRQHKRKQAVSEGRLLPGETHSSPFFSPSKFVRSPSAPATADGLYPVILSKHTI